MSEKSDLWEQAIAKSINKIPGIIKAERPKASPSYSDVKVELEGFRGSNAIWLEVKMNHTDNLMNPRFAFIDNEWTTPPSYTSPATLFLCQTWNKNPESKKWIADLRDFLRDSRWKGDVKKMTIHSGKTERKLDPNSVPVDFMKKYLETRPNKNICKEDNIDIGKLVSTHYLKGKASKTYYLSAADDFYQFKISGSKSNPLNIPNVPVFRGTNVIVLRVGDRTGHFEVQAEVKIKRIEDSQYSTAPGTKKLNPFRFISK